MSSFASGTHRISYRVYWEDTDAGGVVYYANYLKFAERARTEALRALGIHQTELKEKEGVLFVVRHASVDFKKPARLDDEMVIETSLQEMSKVRMTMRQRLSVNNALCAEVTTEIVCVDENFKPAAIPDHIVTLMQKTFHPISQKRDKHGS